MKRVSMSTASRLPRTVARWSLSSRTRVCSTPSTRRPGSPPRSISAARPCRSAMACCAAATRCTWSGTSSIRSTRSASTGPSHRAPGGHDHRPGLRRANHRGRIRTVPVRGQRPLQYPTHPGHRVQSRSGFGAVTPNDLGAGHRARLARSGPPRRLGAAELALAARWIAPVLRRRHLAEVWRSVYPVLLSNLNADVSQPCELVVHGVCVRALDRATLPGPPSRRNSRATGLAF